MNNLRELKIILEENYTDILKYKITLSKYLHESSSLRITQQYLDYGDKLCCYYFSKLKDDIYWYINVEPKFIRLYQCLNRNHSIFTLKGITAYIKLSDMTSKEKEFLSSLFNSRKEEVSEFSRHMKDIKDWSELIEELFDSIRLYKYFIDENYVLDERIKNYPLSDSHELINEIFQGFDNMNKPDERCYDKKDLLKLVNASTRKIPNEEEVIWRELIEAVFDINSYPQNEKNDPYLNLYLCINQEINAKRKSVNAKKRYSKEQTAISHLDSNLESNNKKRKLIEDGYKPSEQDVDSSTYGFC